MKRKSISQRVPEKFTMGFFDGLRIETVIMTTHELDAVIEALMCMRPTLPSTREMIPADIGLEVREPTYMEVVLEIIG